MLKLDDGELEALVDQIPDPLIRAKEGLRRFSPSAEPSAKYAELYIRTLMEGGNKAQRELSHSDSDPASSYFNRLPEVRRKELGQEYLQWRFASLLDLTGKTDQTAITLASVAKTLGLVEETREAATQYFQRRLDRIQNPSSTADLEMVDLFGLAEVYSLPKDRELTALYLATSFFADRWGFAHDKMPQITEENEREAMQKGWRIAQNLWQNSSNVKGLAKLIRNEKFKAVYSSNKTARAIAKNVVAETLKGDCGTKEAKALVDAYQLSELKKIVAAGISRNLEQGNYQMAAEIALVFSYKVTNKMYDSARTLIEQQATVAAKEGKLEEAIEAKLKLKAFDSYRANGLDRGVIPEVDIPRDYSGKILVLEFCGRNYIRSLPPEKTMHSDISYAFQRELRLLGFSARAREKGGADLYFNKAGEVVISGDSHDYGECDKELARELVQKAFPDKKIVANGW